MKSFLAGVAQVGLLMIFSRAMNMLVEFCRLPVPASILGIGVLYLLLQFKIIKLEWIDIGAKWLLAEMLLFLIPAAVGIMQYGDLIRTYGVQLLFAVTVSMLAVMAAAGLLADRLANRAAIGKEAGEQ